MKKTGILTFHAAYNFGSNLQAYALQETVKKLGYDAEIINYRSEKQIGMYSLVNIKFVNKGVIAKNIFNILNCNKILKRNKRFEDFIHNKLNLSQEMYMDEKETENTIGNYDNLICGSDQIWNLSEKTYDRSTTYFLDFKKELKSNNISYAPSFGDDIKNLDKNFEKINGYLKKFNSISLREKDAVDFFKTKGIDTTLVLDPTLLLNKEEWEKLIGEPIIKKPYIFYYSLNYKKFSVDFVNKIAKTNKLPIISPFLHPKGIGKRMKVYGDCGPLEFLNLLYYSRIVCTNSFHGTVFSILFEKNFYAIFNEDENGELIRENRKASLLEQLGLNRNMATNSKYISFEELKLTDYISVKNKLEKLKKESINFLRNNLKG